MHIRPPHGSPTSTTVQGSAADKATKGSATRFDGLLDADVKQTTTAAPISELMKDLKQLASDVKLGKITKEEASRQFVGMVIDKKINLSQWTNNAKKIEGAVADVVEQDPHFVSRLESQLKKLSSLG